ncbi:unnamed protein product [Caenorhabditis brenneri]
MSHPSTKRQSKLEIKAHRRLLPRKVVSEAERPKNEMEIPHLSKMIQKHGTACDLSRLSYTEKRRKRFERVTETLRRNEHEFIKRAISRKEKEERERKRLRALHRPQQDTQSFISDLINGIIEFFCCKTLI